jgi:hypothetical protein
VNGATITDTYWVLQDETACFTDVKNYYLKNINSLTRIHYGYNIIICLNKYMINEQVLPENVKGD